MSHASFLTWTIELRFIFVPWPQKRRRGRRMLFKSLAVAASLALTVTATPTSHGRFHHRRAANESSYEYVIVGSGPGGAPLAARLALAGNKVLLIEAGGDHGDGLNQTVPAWNLKSAEDDIIKWDYFVTHYEDQKRQERDSHMTYRKPDGSYYHGLYPPAGAEPLGILYPRTGALGGCAEHNALITTYPHESDWTYLQQLTGDESWSPGHMRTYFEKLEKAQYVVGSGHGHGGWLRTSLTSLTLVLEDLKLLSIVVSAASAMGKVCESMMKGWLGVEADECIGSYYVPPYYGDFSRPYSTGRYQQRQPLARSDTGRLPGTSCHRRRDLHPQQPP